MGDLGAFGVVGLPATHATHYCGGVGGAIKESASWALVLWVIGCCLAA